MSTARKTLDICFKALRLTDEVMREALNQFMQGNKKQRGKISLKKLNAASHGKLESIEVSDKNIGSFTKTAAKYDINFAVKCDKAQNPPMWHVFFDTCDTKNFKRAFTEYVDKAQDKDRTQDNNQRSLVERLEKVDKEINAQQKEMSRNRDKDRKKERNEPSL